MSVGRYGKRYQPKVLLEVLVKLDYGITMRCYLVLSNILGYNINREEF